MDINNVEIVRSRRKTVSIEIKEDASILVRAPKRVPVWEIERFLKEKSGWIDKHIKRVQDRNEKLKNIEPIGRWELRDIADEALRVIPKKVAYYAEVLGVTYGRITIRNQKTLWGSCSARGNLNFNCMLMKAPERVQDYVVVHELCHRKEMNHSQRFWALVGEVIPEYKECRRWLKENGSVYIAASHKRS